MSHSQIFSKHVPTVHSSSRAAWRGWSAHADESMTIRGDDISSGGDREMIVADAAEPVYTPWQTLSALAAETGQAVRQTFSESGVDTTGHVQEGVQQNTATNGDARSDQWRQPETLPTDAEVSTAPWRVKGSSHPGRVDSEAVHTEINRVQQKMMSTDAATEVILRFNFMGGRESKVPQSCKAVSTLNPSLMMQRQSL